MEEHLDLELNGGENLTDSEAPTLGSENQNRKSSSVEPIAIVGMACRFPGAPSIADFWRLLEEGGNAVTETVPGSGNKRVDELFANIPNPSQACRFCAYVDDIDLFDAGFFQISPAEAQLLDPQQRMMLETAWQALEDAGITPDQLRGSLTGVYTGICNDEYRYAVVESGNTAGAAASLYALSGTNLNGTSGRVSYVLGLMGPSKAVDAACASSLVSVHDAVTDLQHGRADLAIAGGVQANLHGRIFELRADAMMLSPDGQCKSFDASANGYVRGEGCGIVVLKRLSEAEADGDRIWGVIRGSAVNHGGAGSGLTVPHTPGLEQVMKTALQQADVCASDVNYLEAHGTGTTVGDPIEIEAVSAVFCREREADSPLVVGSVKTNFGHLESAAGIAGLIKAVLVVQRGVVPKHLHLQNLNPSIDWEQLPLQITTSLMELPQSNGQPRLAGVNSFGISGTNAHIIVQEYNNLGNETYTKHQVVGLPLAVEVALPETIAKQSLANQELTRRNSRLLPLSGKSRNSLRELAVNYLTWLGEQAEEAIPTEPLLSDMAWSAGIGRNHFDHRAGIVFEDYAELKERLKALVELTEDERVQKPARVAFVYTGQGSQWTGMGKTLYQSEPVVRAVLDRCEEVFRSERDMSLLDVMFGRVEGKGKLNETEWEQPALYALECALTSLWASLGVRPDVVVGHSLGELVAAYAAGVFSLEDGMRFATIRGTLMSQTEQGAMAAVFASPNQVKTTVESLNAASTGVGLSISGDNGAHQVVSGPTVDIENFLNHLDSDGIQAKRLNTTRAFHSPLLDPVLGALQLSLDGVPINPPNISMISNLTGRVVEPDQTLDGKYWQRHAREAVAFADGIKTLAELGVDLVLEIGPRSLLLPLVASTWPESTQTPTPALLSSLQPPSPDSSGSTGSNGFMTAVSNAYQAGLDICFKGLYAGETRQRIHLPGYPFQRESYWFSTARARHSGAGLPLLGERRDSASGEVTFETMMYPDDPEWLPDHSVFGKIIAPSALLAAMAASASATEENGMAVVEEMHLNSAMIFPDANTEDSADQGLKVQSVLNVSENETTRRMQIFSQRSEQDWILNAECLVSSINLVPQANEIIDLENLKTSLSPMDTASYYRTRSKSGVEFGPSFRTLDKIWALPGEALGEISFPANLGQNELDIHPLLLDGCFQVLGAARLARGEAEDEFTYLPFGWGRMWLTDRLPNRIFCHVLMSEDFRNSDVSASELPEILRGELRIYDINGNLLGGLSDYRVKRATKAAMLSVIEGVNDLLYEVTWQEGTLVPGIIPVDFLPSPVTVRAGSCLIADYLEDEGITREQLVAQQVDLERLAHSIALTILNELGWIRSADSVVDAEELRIHLKVIEEQKHLFRRLLEMLAKSGVLMEKNGDFVVKVASDDLLPDGLTDDIELFSNQMIENYPQGSIEIEIGFLRRCAGSLAELLLGQVDALTILFGMGDPVPSDIYRKAPMGRAGMRVLRETIQALVRELPEGRRLRIIEVGAGTGSATASVLPELPDGQFEYVFTDISAGFFAEAEAKFGDGNGCIEYRPLDIERDPISQGFNAHSYDLLIAANVLHATRDLDECLTHCRKLLAPYGQLVAYENLWTMGWMDMTFGQLDGWWRFNDEYRPYSALADSTAWRSALNNTGFGEVEVVGFDESDSTMPVNKCVFLARNTTQVVNSPGTWVLVADRNGLAEKLAVELADQNQTVVLTAADGEANGVQNATDVRINREAVDLESRESWCSLLKNLPEDAPFQGIVHLAALDGYGVKALTGELAGDVRQAVASALTILQGLADADVTPEKGTWFVTRGAQVLECETTGYLAGAPLWGFGKALKLEAAHLQPRMIDLDPDELAPTDLVSELLYPDPETHIAYRRGRRHVARLTRMNTETERLTLPDESNWILGRDPSGEFGRLRVRNLPSQPLEENEVRVGVEAFGLNFTDVFRSLGVVEEGEMGLEMCGQVLEVGSKVSTVAVGDQVVGLGTGTFAAETVTHEELLAIAPPGFTVTELATVPITYVTAALSFEHSGLKPGDRVLIHAGAGGVGLAAVHLVQAAGAEVFTTASGPKHAYLRSIGVKHIFDSRTTAFGKEILESTDGEGVDVVLNSLTGEGFIDASLSCLAQNGRYVELADLNILSEEEMAANRPDVSYHILQVDNMRDTDPAGVGRILKKVMKRLAAGELKPLIHSRWSLSEAGAALKFMRSARHIGKIVVSASPIKNNHVRQNRTYLVIGGLGGIGCAVAGWLADHGAETIVLNGRRPPDSDAEAIIDSLRKRGFDVQVEIADVTHTDAIDAMLARMDRDLPPLGGIIYSAGTLSDGALTNQSWERFETVLWPKILGAWHLHRETAHCDLDMFVLFSSRVGIIGNAGQVNHASANAFLDQLAGHRRAMGLPGQAIAWGSWSEIGEAAEQLQRIEQQRASLGGRAFSPQQGLKVFDQIVRQGNTNSVAMAADWSVFETNVKDIPPLFENLISNATDDEPDSPEISDELIPRLRTASLSEREKLLVSFLQQELQAVLRLRTTPDPTVGFFDLGMDSLMAVELRNRLNRAFDSELTVSNTAVFDYPNVSEFARHLLDQLPEVSDTPIEQKQPEPLRQPTVVQQRTDEDVAIVGMACRFPGAPDIDSYWSQLEAGYDAVTDGRRDPGPWEGVVGDTAAEEDIYRRGGFVEGIDLFDADFFGIRPIEARLMDPRQRLLLETSWHALEDAGIDPNSLRDTQSGVYVGLGSSEYRDLVRENGHEDSYLGTAISVALGRIAFALGLRGPAVPLDMTCASSLAAVHQAATALRQGEVNLSLVGGVHTVFSRAITKFMSEYGMLSPSGRCRTFDASADGFVRGEGCGIVVMKRLSDAIADGDRIWGLVLGSSVNQNGISAALTVPRGTAQEQVLRESLVRAGIPPSEVDYLETHATGSQLGDPIEVRAAASVYGKGRTPDQPLLLGTVKTNIGHLEAAAGVAGLIKVMLSMRRGKIPKHLHCDNPNPHAEWEELPVHVTTEATDWPLAPERPPRAGVSAFAISGTNAHVLVEGNRASLDVDSTDFELSCPAGSPQNVAVPEVKSVPDMPKTENMVSRQQRLLPLSGKTPGALRELAGRYLSWLDNNAQEIALGNSAAESFLSNMAWTASVGRSHFSVRAGIIFKDANSLRDRLNTLTESDANSVSRAVTKVAFAYPAEEGFFASMAEELYQCEPVVRGVLDYCDKTIRTEHDTSLLDIMFGHAEGLATPEWSYSALYAFQCALSALWSSIGIWPDVVVSSGSGVLAAANSAGVLQLEDGLRLAVNCGRLANSTSETDGIEVMQDRFEHSTPSIAMVNQVTGRLVDSGDQLDEAYWYGQVCETGPFAKGIKTLMELGVDAVVEIGADEVLSPEIISAWSTSGLDSKVAENSAKPPTVISSQMRSSSNGEDSKARFVDAVAELYEAGLTPDFTGLFAGEDRCRISLPNYPFQRRRFWFNDYIEHSSQLL